MRHHAPQSLVRLRPSKEDHSPISLLVLILFHGNKLQRFDRILCCPRGDDSPLPEEQQTPPRTVPGGGGIRPFPGPEANNGLCLNLRFSSGLF